MNNWRMHGVLVGNIKTFSEGSVEAIIEKLIEEIPSAELHHNSDGTPYVVDQLSSLKEQLRAKWLGKE